MEDLKKIQEFFSKPIEEISTDSVAMKQQYILTEPVQIAYTKDFGTGMTNAKGVLHQANAGYFIGEEDAYVIILPGGTFYVSKDGEVAMRIHPIRDQSNEFGAALTKTPFAPEYADWKDLLKQAPVREIEIGDKVKIDKNYGGGRGKVEDKIGSFVVVNGKSYHESDVEEILRELASLKAEKGYSPQLVSPENPKGETDGLDSKTMNKILMKVIGDLDELKQLGEGMIEEKLCKKGQAYRKKRMAAGEKSSAYLNGRAVKVCKGQMKG